MKKIKIIISIFTSVLLLLTIFTVRFDRLNEIPFYIKIETKKGEQKIDLWKNCNNEYFFFLPSYAELSKAKIYLNTESDVKINHLKLIHEMCCEKFELDIPYELVFNSFSKKEKSTITFVQSANVSTIYIDTESGSMDYINSKKGNEETGFLNLYNSSGGLNYSGKVESINGRGNYTWYGFDKKAYSISLQYESDLLGLGSAQRWVLLANADDPSNMRNKIVYDFAHKVGLSYSPASRWVDLYLNGEYYGLYQLCERNEVHTERVDLSQKDSFLVSLELKQRLDDQNYPHIVTNSNQALRIHYPLNPTNEQLNFLTKKWQSVENALISPENFDKLSAKSLSELIDIDSWAKKYLIEEVFGNIDANFISQYFYCDGFYGSSKIFAGPVWDYDHSMGSKSLWQLTAPNTLFANRLYAKDGYETPWMYNFYKNNECYNKIVELYKSDFLPLLEKFVNNDIIAYYSKIEQASRVNQIRWNTEDAKVSAEYIVSFMNDRIDFLNSVWIDQTTYCYVKADQGFGNAYAYFAVKHGLKLKELPSLADTTYEKFSGWYYKDTNEPFDINKPIFEDTEIYAKWQSSSHKRIEQTIKLIPIAVISVLFIVLLAVELRRVRRKG